MKAMLLSRTGPIASDPLRCVEINAPFPGHGEIRIKVHCCAICRTDLHVIEGDLPQKKLPVIPGHQIIGAVDALGAGCGRFRLGDRAGVAWLRHTCGTCDYCRRNQENLCESARFTGYQEDGGFAEYAVVSEAFAYAIPETFSDIEAAPLMCAGIIGYRALKRANLVPGGRLAIFGFGSSAHVVLQIALSRGCEVFVVTRGEMHCELARRMGAAWVGQSAAEMPDKADSAILFAPVGELVPQALGALRKGGTLALAGIYMTPIPKMDYEQSLFYERDVRSVTCNTREDGRELLMEAAKIPIRPHVTAYPFVEANRALRDLKNDRISGTGVLVMENEVGKVQVND